MNLPEIDNPECPACGCLDVVEDDGARSLAKSIRRLVCNNCERRFSWRLPKPKPPLNLDAFDPGMPVVP